MEKGAFLPIRFYPAASWTDYEKIQKYSGDVALLKEHYLFFPAFQHTMPDIGRHWVVEDFLNGTIEVINYDTGVASDMTNYLLENPVVYDKAGEFRSLVLRRFPIWDIGGGGFASYGIGRFQYHFIDQDGETEWYSEVFEICDMGTNAVDEFENDTGFAGFTSAPGLETSLVIFCKTGGAVAEAFLEGLEVYLEEELDLYLFPEDTAAACGAANWTAPVYFHLVTAAGLVVSDTVSVDTALEGGSFTLTSTVGGTVRLRMFVEAADTGKGLVYVYLQRRYSPNHVQLRYSNTESFCKIFYEDGYENVFFLDTKQVIDENAIEETVVEDDETNKYRIIGTNKRWNSLQIATGEAMLNAMSLMRLHDDIKFILETGEPVVVDEILMEQSVLDFEASKIKLVYREASCSVEACGFEPCDPPSPALPIMEFVEYTVAGLPAAAAGNSGWRVMVRPAAGANEFQVYLSNGAAWAVDATYDVDGNTLEARQNINDEDFAEFRLANRYFWYDTGTSRWIPFIRLAQIFDNADGTAGVQVFPNYLDGLTLQSEFQDSDGNWNPCSALHTLVNGAGAITQVCNCGVGTFNFRSHIWTDGCDYGYTAYGEQTIT